MATIPNELSHTIVGLSMLFSKRAWPLVVLLLVAAILAVKQRTVSPVLRVMGLSDDAQFQKSSVAAASRAILSVCASQE